MPSGSDFIFCLQTKDYRFWQLDNSGNISVSSKPYFLDFSPSGWDDISIQNVRNKNYWGIDRTVTIPLNYVKDGAKILKHIFYNLGIEESCYLSISNQQLDYEPNPPGAIHVSTGANPFTAGANTGTITGTPGTTVYIKASINGGISDYINGNIGGSVFINEHNTSNSVYTITIPQSGTLNYSIFFTNTSGTGTANIATATVTGATNTGNYGYWYKQIYRGEVDLSTFNHNGSKVTCTTLEDGLAKYLKANENTVYEFKLDVPQAVNIKMDGINLHDTLNYQDISDLPVSLADFGTNYPFPTRFLTPTVYVSNEGDSVGILTKSQNVQSNIGQNFAQVLALDNFLLQNLNLNPVTLLIKGFIEFNCTKAVLAPYDVSFRFLRSNQLEVDENDYQIYRSPALTNGQKYFLPYSLSITLAMNEKLFLQGTFTNLSGFYPSGFVNDTVISFTENSRFSASFNTRQQSTSIKGFTLQYLFEQLISKVTEGNYTAQQSAFFEKHKNKIITSGNGIRNLLDREFVYIATLQVSLKTVFKFCDCIDSVGLSEKNKTVNLDTKENLIDSINVIDLPEVGADSLKITVAKDYLFNEGQFGYPELKNDVGVLNGNEEFNTRVIFSLGTTKSPGVLDKISPIKASCYEIEKIRVTTLEKNSTDYKADNDVFVLEKENDQPIIYTSFESYSSTDNRISLSPPFASTLSVGFKLGLNGSTYTIALISGTEVTLLEHIGTSLGTTDISVYGPYNLDRSLNATATGLIERETVFNLGLTPKRMFLNNGSFIRSSLYLSDTKTFKFISSDKNNKVVAGGIVENANVNVGSLAPKFFLPILFDFTIKAPDNLEDLLDNNPLRLFRFPFKGDIYTGILVKVSAAPSNRKEQTYQLMSTASNNLSSLIEYFGG